ncbi:MAG: large-conductance mechanosensitive channel protein MscL [bacterium]
MQKAKTFIGELKEFAMKGNVMDLAIGVIIGGAFGKIISSLVSDIIMPPIGMLMGGFDMKDLTIVLHNGAGTRNDVVMNIGIFLQNCIDFAIIATALFLTIKALNKIKAKKEEEKVKEISEEIKLLSEIRDLLKK